MRAFYLTVLLCALSAHAFAGTPGISGEWIFYGNQAGKVRIDEASGILEDGTSRTQYLLFEEGGAEWRCVARKDAAHSGDARKLLRVHTDLLLFLGVKNPILVREGARFKAPRKKIRGRWHYAAQMNEAFYYDAEFDLDAWQMVEISPSKNGGHTRSAGRSLEVLLDAQTELALQSGGGLYHFARLGSDFLVLEPSYATSTRDGYKILMEKMLSPGVQQQADTKSRAAKASKTKKTKQKKPGKSKRASS